MFTNPAFIAGLQKSGHYDVFEHASASILLEHRDYGKLSNLTYMLLHPYMTVREASSGRGFIVSASMRTWYNYLSLEKRRTGFHEILLGVAPKIFEPLSSPEIVPSVQSPSKKSPHVRPEQLKDYQMSARVMMLSADVTSQSYSTSRATFLIEGVSRSLTHQLVRHRKGSYSQESQRYVDMRKSGGEPIIPPSIEENDEAKDIFEEAMIQCQAAYERLRDVGIRKEDARFVLPSAAPTRIVMTMTLEDYRYFLSQRCAKDAQWEIRSVAHSMLFQLFRLAPDHVSTWQELEDIIQKP